MNDQYKTIEEHIKTALLLGGASVLGYYFYGPVGAVAFPIMLFCAVAVLVALVGIFSIWILNDLQPTEKTNKGESDG